MEILIVGIIVVALMVYVSTRIKKSAETAFERETIEGEDFSLVKPAGFLHPLRDDSGFAFEAYSKDYGEENLKNVWRSNAEMIAYADENFKTVCDNAKNSAEKILSEEILKNAPDDQRICLIESEQIIDDAKKRVFRKIVESASRKKVYELKIFVLEEALPEFSPKAHEMLESFTVK